MSVFSIVTARSGSKGCKNKNIRKINNKAVFEYSIEYSQKLNDVIGDKVFTIVSSDSSVIENYCKKKNIPFINRSKKLSSDTARIEDVIYDAYKKIGKNFEYISLLYGSVTTRYPDEFVKAYKFLKQNQDYHCVLSMKNVGKYNPNDMFELNLKRIPKKENVGHRRQDLKQFMIHDGHTILFKSNYFVKFMEKKRKAVYKYEQFGKKIKPLINDKIILDIDTENDFIIVKSFLKYI